MSVRPRPRYCATCSVLLAQTYTSDVCPHCIADGGPCPPHCTLCAERAPLPVHLHRRGLEMGWKAPESRS